MTGDIAVVRTGSANLASVLAALRRLGATPRVATAPADLDGARAVVLPGVGALAAAMQVLVASDLVDALRRHVAAGQPFLAICLGLQLLGTGSEESPGVAGLGLVDGIASRFPASVRVPQLGWNRVAWPGDPTRDGFAYYANSYALRDAPTDWAPAYTDHGGRFLAAIERPRQLACQFHPELSGRWGAALLERWWTQC